ncbi:uncharacterized protein [Diadema antillarum]|uniref:uncharacterized protein n=1 Tax=Diadema antillarum TaxID=105358 RepID=UPI003A8A93E7
MAAEERERAAKKKLQYFLAQMLKMGCVKGFKYFNTYMRGREEMICTVLNDDEVMLRATPQSAVDKTRFSFNKTPSGSYDELPLEQKELLLSQNTQRKLSGFGYMDIGLPPASPSEREIGPISKESTLFLLAGYGKYSCPYVWVRSNHERLIKLSDNPSFSKDSPLRLKSTAMWAEKDVKVWQILAELVKLCTRPAPKNPFEVDMDYFEALERGERVIALGAMAYFLQCVVSQGSDRSFSGLVVDDLREIQRWHLREFQQLLQENMASHKQDQLRQRQTRGVEQTKRASSSLSSSEARRAGQGVSSPRGPGMAVSQSRQPPGGARRVGGMAATYGRPGQAY